MAVRIIALVAVGILAAGCGGTPSGAHTNLQHDSFSYPVATQSLTSDGGTFAFPPCTGPAQAPTTQIFITFPQNNIPAGVELALTSVYCVPPPCIGCNPPLGSFSFLTVSTGAPASGSVTFSGNVLVSYQTTASNLALQIGNSNGVGTIATCSPAIIGSGSVIFSCPAFSVDLSKDYYLNITSS